MPDYARATDGGKMWHNLLEEGTFSCRPGRWAFLLLWLLFTCFCFLRASTITTLRQRDGATVRLLRRKCLLLNIYQSAMVRTGRVLSAPVAPQKSSADELHESHCDVACGVSGRKMAPNRQSSLPEFENEKKKTVESSRWSANRRVVTDGRCLQLRSSSIASTLPNCAPRLLGWICMQCLVVGRQMIHRFQFLAMELSF